MRSWSSGGEALHLPEDFQGPAWMHEEQGDPEREAFGVLPDNWNAAQIFFSCGTQWRQDKNGVLIGLRYDALDIVMRHSSETDSSDAFARVQIMESAAVDEARRMAPRT